MLLHAICFISLYICFICSFWQATFQSSYRIDLAWKKPLLTGASGMSGYKVWVDDGNGGGINNLIWDGGTRAPRPLIDDLFHKKKGDMIHYIDMNNGT